MAKVITFSKKFPKGHPRQGEPTNFKSKILNHEKTTTVRSGFSRNIGDFFSPREWIGLPYRTKQKKISGDIEIVSIHELQIFSCHAMLKSLKEGTIHPIIEEIAENDGLDPIDFINWFMKSSPFTGQIIGWNDVIYGDCRAEYFKLTGK